MKSILFTHMREKLILGEKNQTGRTTFIPQFPEEREEVYIDFKHKNGARERLFIAEIVDYYPKLIKNFTLIEAKRDGFKSIKEFQNALLKINKLKSMNLWAFLIIFERTSDLILEFIKQPLIENQAIELWM